MTKLTRAVAYVEKHFGRNLISNRQSYYDKTTIETSIASWLMECHRNGDDYKTSIGEYTNTKHSIHQFWSIATAERTMCESPEAVELGLILEERDSGHGSFKHKTHVLSLVIDRADILDYVETCKVPPTSKTFKASFTDQGYVYTKRAFNEIGLHMQIHIMKKPDLFEMDDKSASPNIIPKAAPKSHLATNKQAAVKSRVGKYITKYFAGALTLVYGGEWDCLQPDKAERIAYGFNSRPYRQTMLEEEFEATENSIIEMVTYLEKVQIQNDKLKKMVKDAGGSTKFKAKFKEDFINIAQLQAVVWANDDNQMLKDISVAVLGG